MFKPARNYLLVELVEETTKTKSGLILPDSADSQVKQYRILSAGLDDRTYLELKAGQIVLLDRQPKALKLDGKELLLACTDWVLGVLETGH